MLIKALAAAVTLTLATAIGQWLEYPTWGVVLGVLSVIAMMQVPKDPLLFMTIRQKARIRRDFYVLELAAWFAAPAIYILDKERPGWTRSEMRILFKSMDIHMANHNGAEREVFTHLHRVAQSPQKPIHAYEKMVRQISNRFTAKRARKLLSEAFVAAAHLIARVNAPDEVTAWLCIQADDFGLEPAMILDIINKHQKLFVDEGERIAVIGNDYPMSYFPDHMVPAHRDSMRFGPELNELHRQIYLYRQHNSEMGYETEHEEYDRTVKWINALQ